jgi:hypothetical protein
MGHDRAATRKVSPVPPEKVTPVDFGRGLNTLVSAHSPEKPASTPAVLLPAWFFFAADLLLLAFTVVICADASDPMQAGEALFAAISTTLGSILGIAGVYRIAMCEPADKTPKE